jgi:hypothetical protein
MQLSCVSPAILLSCLNRREQEGTRSVTPANGKRAPSRLATLVALWTMAFVLLGMPLIHPWLHFGQFSDSPLSFRALLSLQPPGRQAEEAPALRPAEACPICEFLAIFHGDSASLPSHEVAPAPVVGTQPSLHPLLAGQLHGRRLVARSPPL